MTLRNRGRRPLTDLQQTILERLWSAGPATAERIREALRSKKHPLKDSTVRTLLRRLEERGYVSHSVDERVFLYRAEAPPRSIAARTVQDIIDRFWSGSIEEFLVGMVDEQVLSVEELQRLAAKVRRRK